MAKRTWPNRHAKSYESRSVISYELRVALKGILCTVVENSVASVAPYTTLGTVPTAVFIALVTLLIMFYSDVGLFAACQMLIDACSPERFIPLEITGTPLGTIR